MKDLLNSKSWELLYFMEGFFMFFIFKIKQYTYSGKIQAINGFLLVLDLIAAFFVWGIFYLCVLGKKPGEQNTTLEIVISVIVAIIFFIIVHVLINKYTDKKYEAVLVEYQNELKKLMDEDPQTIKDKHLRYPAHITIKRISSFYGFLVGLKCIINGETYKLKNGESVKITSFNALNTMAIKGLHPDENLYFTAKDNENITLEFTIYGFKSIKRD